MKPRTVRSGPCQEQVREGREVDLGLLPIQICWPGDVGPLITWGLVVTRGPQNVPNAKLRQNLGIYRQQPISRHQVIMRWLAHRGGALDFRDFSLANPGQPFPIAVALGADPATILGAVTPVPDTLSEYQFAGLLRGSRTEVVDSSVGEDGMMLQVPATAEIVLEGHIPVATARRSAEGVRRLPVCIGGSVRRPHGVLQRVRLVPGVRGQPHDVAHRPDLSLYLHRQAAR